MFVYKQDVFVKERYSKLANINFSLDKEKEKQLKEINKKYEKENAFDPERNADNLYEDLFKVADDFSKIV